MTGQGRLRRRYRRISGNPALVVQRFARALDRYDRKINGYHINEATWDRYEPAGLIHKGRKP